MRRATWLVTGVFLALAGGVSGAADRGDSAAFGGPIIRWPSPERRDLQSAIDAAPDGAILEIEPGVFTIPQPLRVKGKRLVIQGAGSGLDHGNRTAGQVTRLVGPPPRRVTDERGNVILRADEAQGLLNSAGAELVVRGLHLSGFDAGIATSDGDDGRSRPTIVRDVFISDTGRGILLRSSGGANIADSRIENSAWNGISAVGAGDVTLQKVVIADAEGTGIYLTEGSSCLLVNVVVMGAQNGGILAFHSKAVVLNSVVAVNGKFGILLYEAQGIPYLKGNDIAYTHSIAGGLLGVGIMAVGSEVIGVENLILENDLTGVLAQGGLVHLGDNQIECSPFDFLVQEYQGVMGNFQGLGGDVCGCGGVTHACTKDSVGLGPPDPPDGQE